MLLLPVSVMAFNPATLYKMNDRVAVYTQEQAAKFFGNGYKLETSNRIGSAASTGITGIKIVQAQAFTLAGSGAVIGATSITLKSMKNIDGSLLTMSNFGDQGFGTLEPGTTGQEEQITFYGITQNINGTATLTGVKRVLNIYPYTETAGLATTHAGGTKFVVSNTAGFYNTFVNKENSDTLNGVIDFKYRPTSTTSPSTALNQVATINDVMTATTTGGVNATESIKGVSELATGAEAGASTQTGSTGARLVLPTSISTSTGGVANTIPVTGATGLITPGFYQGNNNVWSGTNTFSATTTLNRVTIGANVSALIASTSITGATTPQPVYIATSTSISAGNALLVDGDVQDSLGFVGFAITSAATGSTVYIQTAGIVNGFAGLTKGADYYVSDNVGVISTTTGTYDVFVGTAISATEILISKRDLQYIGSVTVANNSSVAIRPETRMVIIYGSTSNVTPNINSTLVTTLMRKGITVANVGIQAGDTGSADVPSYVQYTWSGNTITTNNAQLTGNATIYMYR